MKDEAGNREKSYEEFQESWENCGESRTSLAVSVTIRTSLVTFQVRVTIRNPLAKKQSGGGQKCDSLLGL